MCYRLRRLRITRARARRPPSDWRTLRHTNFMFEQTSLALQNWALDIARRSTMRKARVALARRLAVIMFAMLKHGAEFEPA